ncbi:MAG: efflux RND transporter periplasmic adaptor subunit [Planctomycetota bacterium]|jgi:RND family efflux transporter MFP subunit
MKQLVKGVLFLVVVVGIVLYAAGFFGPAPIAPGEGPAAPGAPAPARTVRAEQAEVPVNESAVGTVRSRARIDVAAQLTARIVAVRADAGQKVRAGDELVVLDDREFSARLKQSRQALVAAEAARDSARQAKIQAEARLAQARSSHQRIQRLVENKAATPQEMDDAQAVLRAAEARVTESGALVAAADARIQRAQEVVAEGEINLGHTRIAAPIDGVVAERTVEPGDLAWPGRSLLVVLDPRSLRLEAQVREGLIARVREGDRLGVEVPAAAATVEGTVAEILPAADPQSRTFRVRVNFAPAAGVYPGMFGRLRIPARSCGSRPSR